jgi:MFS family permease
MSHISEVSLGLTEDKKSSIRRHLELYQEDNDLQNGHAVHEDNHSNPMEQKYLWLRWAISFCDCCVQITKFYCMDIAQALQTHFMNGEMNLNATEYNLFYSVFAYIIILPFFAGFVSDRLGVRKGIFLFAVLQLSGQYLFTFGGFHKNVWIMLLGRLIFGFAALCMEVCEDVVLSAWFMNKELTLALGLSFSSCRIGTALTSILSPQIYEWTGGMFVPLIVASVVCTFGFFMALIMIAIDVKYKKYVDPDNSKLERSLMSHQINTADIKKLHLNFWVIVFTGFLVYTTFYGFVDNGNDILGKLYNYSPPEAGEILFGVYIFAGLFTPLCGLVIDKIGRRLTYSSLALVMYVIPHILLAFLPSDSPKWLIIIVLILQTISFSMYAAIFWGIIPLVVKENVMGTAFGIVYSSLNACLVFASLAFGLIHDETKDYRGGYFFCMIFVIFLILITWFSSYFTWNINKKLKGKLNSSERHTSIRKSIYE